jgi:hypothetical protein
MHQLRLGVTTVTVAVTAVGAVLLSGAGPASAASTWTIGPAAPAGGNSSLHAIAAIPGTDGAWAVGGYGDPPGGNPLYELPVIDSWNGTSWSQATVPAPSGYVADLTAVSASGASDAWAVGYTTPDLVSATPWAMHWNGSTWSTEGSATAALISGSQLTGVADISPTDAYAISYNPVDSLSQVIHWNGSTWSVVAVPQPGTTETAPYDLYDVTSLTAISADGPDDVWAVGGYFPQGTSLLKPYALHFNGTTWSVATLPQVSGASRTAQYEFGSVVANSPTDVWAVGETYQSPVTSAASATASSTLIEHWNGTAWSVVPSPSPGTRANLTGVATSNAANDVSAVGYYTPAGATTPQTLILNWNGTAWSTVTSPNATASDTLTGVAATEGSSALAVGASVTGDAQSALVLQGS